MSAATYPGVPWILAHAWVTLAATCLLVVGSLLLGLPVRVAPALAACNDAYTVEQLLTSALRDALADIAKLTAADLELVA